ncbi:hypothetical protein ACIBCU_22910 [Streptomyces sp. NPDC051064]|uniref:hypothetical protein n=1 Tax=Streptomyces sp. NPDC051064 TaxID=3365641 RepID=UPI003792DC7A
MRRLISHSTAWRSRYDIDALVELALKWDVDRIELANTQFYGWGLLNRDASCPVATSSPARWSPSTGGASS